MRLFLILVLPLLLSASKILNYNIYDRSDRVDVMITFDTPFNGAIKQSSSNDAIIVKLDDATIESSKVKQLSSDFINSITITPMQNYTQIVASVPSHIKLQVSKTSDSYGLRLRFSKDLAQKSDATSAPLSQLPTKKESELDSSYYIVIAILIVGIIILLVLKKKVTTQTNSKSGSPWLFEASGGTQAPKPQAPSDLSTREFIPSGDGVSIRFQKMIDPKNSVVMLDFRDQSYLVLMGSSNILLDKFIGDRPSTQNEFETILEQRHKQLDEFLNHTSTKDALHAYKERAAAISYDT